MVLTEPGAERAAGPTVRLAIADAGRLFRESLAQVLHQPGQVEVMATDDDDPHTLERLARLSPDVLLISTQDGSGALAASLRQLRQGFPGLRILILTAEETGSHLVGCLEAGASGCLLRTQSLEELRQAVAAVAAGEPVYPPGLAGSLFHRLADLGRERRRRERLQSLELTSRELEILQMIAEGLSNKDIATRLCLSIHTVKNHIHKVLEVLGVGSRWEAVRLGVGKGWLRDRRAGRRAPPERPLPAGL